MEKSKHAEVVNCDIVEVKQAILTLSNKKITRVELHIDPKTKELVGCVILGQDGEFVDMFEEPMLQLLREKGVISK